MKSTGPRVGRWILGGVVVAAATILFEAAGQPSPRLSPAVVNGYRAVAADDRDVQTALEFALADQKRKNRSDSAVKLVGVLTAERQVSAGENFRLCLSLDRRGRADTARVVVHRNQKKRWSVALWAWGACGKQK
jgi:hypothetical protein